MTKAEQEHASGFDVVLGNPPWERIKLQEQEHWVDVPEVAQAPNKSAREKKIAEWRSGDERQRARIALFDAAKYRAEAESRFVRASERFPLTAVGDVNTYALFAELDRDLLAPTGRAGVIVPTGIATDDTTKMFFGDLNEQQQLVSLFDFQNTYLFPGVGHGVMHFCLITIGFTYQPAQFCFSAIRPEHLLQSERLFTLSQEDIALINPNTRTCAVFRTRADAELTKKIYRRVPVLVNERTEQNPWGVSFLRMFDMSNDSGLFRDAPVDARNDSIAGGTTPPQPIDGGDGNESSDVGAGSSRPQRAATLPFGGSIAGNDGNETNDVGAGSSRPQRAATLPLYEAKLLHQFTHRWATYDGSDARDMTLDELRDPRRTVTPRYWIDRAEVEARLAERHWTRGWLLGFRDIARATDERTAIFGLLPISGVGHTAPLIFLLKADVMRYVCFIANVNSVVFDFIVRQKMGGTHLTFTVVNQLPVLPPSAFSAADIAFIVPRVLELVYTAWDMQPFAEDVWAEADDALRAEMLQRNAACNSDAPVELFAPRAGFALPPFRWNDERRAVIRAELDARIARLYGLSRDELRYILDPHDVYGPDFPGETFRVLQQKEIKLYGEYRTRRLVLHAWDNA